MVSLEQVQLLESKVARAIEYVKKVTEENSSLALENSGLMNKLESTQKRLDELELLVMSFKEDQGRIEDGIMAALDRLSQFEEAFENSLKEKSVPAKKPAGKKPPDPNSGKFFEITDTIEKPDDVDEVSSSEETGELDIF